MGREGREHSALRQGESVWLSTKHAPTILFVKEREVMSPIPEFWARSAKSASKHSSHLSDLTANKTIQNASGRWSTDTVRRGENHYRKRFYSLGWKNRGTLPLLGKAGRCPMKESFAPSEELISVRPPSAPHTVDTGGLLLSEKVQHV